MQLAHECTRSHNVKRSHTEELLWVENAVLPQHFRDDRHSRVYGVRDNQDERLGARCCDACCEIADDTRVDLEEIVTRHARLTWHAGRDDDEVSILEGCEEAVVGGEVASDFGGRSNVRKVGGDTGGVDDIEQRELQGGFSGDVKCEM